MFSFFCWVGVGGVDFDVFFKKKTVEIQRSFEATIQIEMHNDIHSSTPSTSAKG